jgi:hypothetical protein
MNTLEIVVAGIDMEVDFDYSAAVPGVYRGPCDRSYPDELEEIDIIAVRCPTTVGTHGIEWVDLLEVLTDKTIENIEDQISNAYNDM